MSSISVPGILLGILVHFLANFAFGFVQAIALGFADPSSLSLVLYGGVAASVVIAVGAGYVAAYAAGRGERVNGALSVFLAALVGLLLNRAIAPVDLEPQHIIGMIAPAPLFGFLGGYLRRWQRQPAQQP